MTMLEVCVDNPKSYGTAVRAGADRIEICGPLNVGGTTPSMGFLQWACDVSPIPMRVMIRNRGGDFYYDGDDVATMIADIATLPDHPMIQGIVFGALTPDNTLDYDTMMRIKDALNTKNESLKFTCHRAFDVAPDYEKSFQILNAVGVDTVLSSGQNDLAVNAIATLASMATVAGNVDIMTCGGFKPTEQDVHALQTGAPAPWFHVAGAELYNGNQTDIFMGDGDDSDSILITKDHLVSRVKQSLQNLN